MSVCFSQNIPVPLHLKLYIKMTSQNTNITLKKNRYSLELVHNFYPKHKNSIILLSGCKIIFSSYFKTSSCWYSKTNKIIESGWWLDCLETKRVLFP